MPRDWSHRHQSGDGGTTRSARERSVARLASGQRQLIRGDQFEVIGFSRNGISRRVRSRRLFVLHPGVYALHPPPYDRDQRYLAAVFAGGPGSLLSHWANAAHFGLTETTPS